MICCITTFKEETAGISEHPAELLNVPPGKSDRGLEPLPTMIERQVSPTQNAIRHPGSSVALKNLVSDGLLLVIMPEPGDWV